MPKKPLNELKELIGWESTAFEVHLERGRIADFAEATFAEDDLFRDIAKAHAQGFADVPVPPTFFGSIFFRNLKEHRPDLGFKEENVLHGQQEFKFERVPVAGETLYATTTLTDLSQKDRREGGKITFAEYTTTFRDENGELVLTDISTGMEVIDE